MRILTILLQNIPPAEADDGLLEVISESKLLIILAVGVSVFIGLRLTKRLITVLPMQRRWRKRLMRNFPLAEGVIWVALGIRGIEEIIIDPDLRDKMTLAIAAVLLLWVAWFALRDLVAGIVLRTEGAIAIEERVRMQDLAGRIIRMRYRTFDVETDGGEIASIPYSKVSGEIRVKPNPSERLTNHTFDLTLPRTDDPDRIVRHIRTGILNTPWASVKRLPDIKLKDETDSRYIFAVMIFSLDPIYFTKIKARLLDTLPDADIRTSTPDQT